MYLSRIKLNPGKDETVYALDNCNTLHGIVETCFKDYPSKKLWRIDEISNSTFLLIASEIKPNFTILVKKIGYDGDIGETRNYDKVKKLIAEGSTWRFKLTGCPMAQVNGKKKRIEESRYNEWLLKRTTKNGFEVNERSLHVTDKKVHDFKSMSTGHINRKITFESVTFEGILMVKDPSLFWKTLCNGIGKEKAYGNGLLTIAR